MRKIEIIKPTIVPKKWGYEEIICSNEKYCGKVLHFNAGAKLSAHHHVLKEEHFKITKGTFTLLHFDVDTGDKLIDTLNPGDIVHIKPGMSHQLFCSEKEDGEIYEFSSQDFSFDSYRTYPSQS